MKLAYLMNPYDHTNLNVKSGLGSFVFNAFKARGIELLPVYPEKLFIEILFKIKSFVLNRLFKKHYTIQREPYLLKKRADRASAIINQSDCDAVFSFGGLHTAYINTNKPLIFWTDAVFAGLVGFYDDYSHFTEKQKAIFDETELDALSRASAVVFSSEWGKQTAMKFYNLDPGKISVIPLGALIYSYPDENEITLIINKRSQQTFNFLFLGVDLKRKRYDLACKIIDMLNEKGCKSILHVAGNKNTVGVGNQNIVSHGFLNKHIKSEAEQLENIFKMSHLMIFMSEADVTPHAINEANAFAVPCIGSDVGGMKSVITEGKNGFTFSLDESLDIITDRIISLLSNFDEYQSLAKSSYDEFRHQLNWDVSVEKIVSLIQDIINKSKK